MLTGKINQVENDIKEKLNGFKQDILLNLNNVKDDDAKHSTPKEQFLNIYDQ